MSIKPKTFRYELSPSGVASITLTRPDTLNSLTFEVYEELRDTFAALDHVDAVRAVLITGEGRAFCSGGDVNSIIGELFSRDMKGLVAFTRVTGALIRNIRALRRPVVAAVNGTAVGAGAVMALACDFRIASSAAKFGFIFPKVGLCGADMGAAYLLPRVVGLARANELLFLGDVVGAEDALRIGLVSKVVAPEACVPEALALAERLASGPAFAHAMTKQMLESEHTMTLDQAIEAEAQAQAICMQHPDFRTAYDAWVKKEPCVFEGATIPFIAAAPRAADPGEGLKVTMAATPATPNPPNRTRASWSALPMFFDDAHRALGKDCDAALTDADVALHEPARVVPRLAELGLTKLLVPAAQGGGAWGNGGANIDVRALSIAREAIAYVSPLADSIFAVQGLGSHPILLAGEGTRRAPVLAEVVAGTRVCAFALTEPEAGSDVASMRTTARRDGDSWILDGEKVFISNVGIANHYVVFANADPAQGKKGISAFLVDAKAEGLTTEPIAMSVDHPLGRVGLHACKVPASALIGEVGHGLRLALGTLDVFRTSVGAAAVGMARRALDEAIARTTTRIQFGKPLAEFQLTQAALADMATELDAARLLVFRAAWEKDQPGSDAPDARRASATSVAMAKMYATEAAQRIIDRAVQLFGGLGVTDRCVVDRLYREIRPLRIYEGTTEIQKLIIGGALVAAPK